MAACVRADGEPPSIRTVVLLNLAYTFIVFAWLFDTSKDDRFTRGLTGVLMRVIGWA
jgi:hypothetical protein